MNKFLSVTLILLFVGIKSFSQTINLSSDSVTTLLCKKWSVTHLMMNNVKKMEKPSDIGTITFVFNKDKTFSFTDGYEKITGVWQYDSKLKTIRLISHEEFNASITSLNKTELTMLVAPENEKPSAEKLGFICRVKAG